MVLNKDIRIKIVNLRLVQQLSWKNVVKSICSEFDLENNTKQFAKIKKAGQREIKAQLVEDGVFTVESVTDRRTRNQQFEYFVKWNGSSEQTWEPRHALILTDTMQSYIDEYDDFHS